MDRESQNIQKSLRTSSIVHGKSRVYFSKSPIMVGQFHLNNLNNKANESQMRGNTRETGQTLRFILRGRTFAGNVVALIIVFRKL